MKQELHKTKYLGSLSPKDALAYMKSATNLFIVDTATAREYAQKHFDGAVNIHYSEMPKRYDEIPKNATVLLHCRLGMVVPRAYEVLKDKRPDIVELSYIDGAPLFDEYNEWNKSRRLRGGLTPEEALKYMKTKPDLVIVEVNAPEWKIKTPFVNAIHIPYKEMAKRYDEIPKNRPVMLHCGGGIVSVEAYKTLQEKRPDIPELSYIAGTPPINAFNEWYATRVKKDKDK